MNCLDERVILCIAKYLPLNDITSLRIADKKFNDILNIKFLLKRFARISNYYKKIKNTHCKECDKILHVIHINADDKYQVLLKGLVCPLLHCNCVMCSDCYVDHKGICPFCKKEYSIYCCKRCSHDLSNGTLKVRCPECTDIKTYYRKSKKVMVPEYPIKMGMCITDLPIELIHKILGYLTLSDFMNFINSSASFKGMFSNTDIIKKAVKEIKIRKNLTACSMCYNDLPYNSSGYHAMYEFQPIHFDHSDVFMHNDKIYCLDCLI